MTAVMQPEARTPELELSQLWLDDDGQRPFNHLQLLNEDEPYRPGLLDLSSNPGASRGALHPSHICSQG